MSETIERRIGILTLIVDRSTCIAADNCTRVAPELFRVDARGIVELPDETPEIDRERLVDACRSCPVQALSIVDENGETIVP